MYQKCQIKSYNLFTCHSLYSMIFDIYKEDVGMENVSYLFNNNGIIFESNYRTRNTISAWYIFRLYKELLEKTKQKNDSEQNRSAIFMPVNVNPNLLKYLCENPAKMYQLSPDVFEDVMAELYKSYGFEKLKLHGMVEKI